jgi:hypothetical protein
MAFHVGLQNERIDRTVGGDLCAQGAKIRFVMIVAFRAQAGGSIRSIGSLEVALSFTILGAKVALSLTILDTRGFISLGL